MREGLRLARDHAAEDANFGVVSDDVLCAGYEGATPATAAGARTCGPPTLIERRKPLVLDTVALGKSIPGAIGLRGAGIGGAVFDEFQGRLRCKVRELTGPIAAMGCNAERFQGRNLALRVIALGHTNVYWYRGGREARGGRRSS